MTRELKLEAALKSVVQRLESHGEGCCKLDVRDQLALKFAHSLFEGEAIGDEWKQYAPEIQYGPTICKGKK